MAVELIRYKAILYEHYAGVLNLHDERIDYSQKKNELKNRI